MSLRHQEEGRAVQAMRRPVPPGTVEAAYAATLGHARRDTFPSPLVTPCRISSSSMIRRSLPIPHLVPRGTRADRHESGRGVAELQKSP